MEYYFYLKDTYNFIHSIDNCVVSYYLKCSLEHAINILHEEGKERSTYYENLNKLGCSKWSYFQNHIHYDDGIYIKLGKYRIFREDKKRIELLPIVQFEINPNKHAKKESFSEIIDFIKVYCTDGVLDNYDYAIDIPKPLDDIQVIGTRKEKGLYKGTRYYGQRNQHGYCKIYDKAKEQCLPEILSRVEHTLSNSKKLSLEKFFIRDTEANLDLSCLSNSTRTIVLLCLEVKQLGGDYESIIDNSMDRRLKKTVLEHIKGEFIEYKYDLNILNQLLEKMFELFNISYTDANGFMHGIDEPLPFD